jgi:hypothetical protein
MLEYACNKKLLKSNDQNNARKWLEATPKKVFDENLKTNGKTVRSAISTAIDILERNWKPEIGKIGIK